MSDAMLGGNGDVVLLSPTGTGKTLAYLLPLVHMLDASSEEVRAVVIVPGRELALQSHEVFRAMGCGLKSMCLYGGRPAMDEHRELRKIMPQVVFATPGRLVDHLEKGNIDAGGIRYLVIDEFDKCLKMGFAGEMSKALGLLGAVSRRFLMSATDADEIPSFVSMGRAVRLDFLNCGDVHGRIGRYAVKSRDKDKVLRLLPLFCARLETAAPSCSLTIVTAWSARGPFSRARGSW